MLTVERKIMDAIAAVKIKNYIEGRSDEKIVKFNEDRRIEFNRKVVASNTIQVPSYGICYIDPYHMLGMAKGMSHMQFAYWLYCHIFNRNVEAGRFCRNYSFTAKIDPKKVADKMGMPSTTFYRNIAKCIEDEVIYDEGDSTYSLSPMYCPWHDTLKVLKWYEDELYRKTRGERGGMKKKVLVDDIIDIGNWNVDLDGKVAKLQDVEYVPSAKDYAMDYIRCAASSGKEFSFSINDIMNHMHKHPGLKQYSKSSIYRAYDWIDKNMIIIRSGKVLNGKTMFKLNTGKATITSDKRSELGSRIRQLEQDKRDLDELLGKINP